MKIHEFQAKDLLRSYGVPVPEGGVARTPEEAEAVARGLDGSVVVKAQIHAGGRGKGGGIRLAESPAEARRVAGEILGMQLVTPQTGPEGRKVKQVLVEKAAPSSGSCTWESPSTAPRAGMWSWPAGRAVWRSRRWRRETPEAILRETVHPGLGLLPYQANRLAFGLGFEGAQVRPVTSLLINLFEAYRSTSCSIAEINPLIVTGGGEVLALDAKINFDDNAVLWRKEHADLRDIDEEDPLEVEASKYGLSYIRLDGEIGCMVNGAGLAMATMDIIKLAGGEPANFPRHRRGRQRRDG